MNYKVSFANALELTAKISISGHTTPMAIQFS